MRNRKFYLYKSSRNGAYTAEILDPETGKKICTRNTGLKSRDEALLKVADWLRDGIPARKSGPIPKARPPKAQGVKAVAGLRSILKSIEKTARLDADGAMQIAAALRDRGLLDIPSVKPGPGGAGFIGFLERFWDYDESPYIREKLAHGHAIGRRHCYESGNRIQAFYRPYFEERLLGSISRQDIKEFSLSLADKREKPEGHKGHFSERLSAATINSILLVGTSALSWAYREGLISANPAAGLARFSGTPRKRGVLTPLEAQAIFATEWADNRSYVASLLACTTGLRAGEVLALRKSDIEGSILNVRHSWSFADGLKSPKNGEERKAPLLPKVREALEELIKENPYSSRPDPFIFYSALPDKPMDQKFLVRGIKAACAATGIDSEARGIVFHSWRHYYAARMADRMTADQITRITGHKTRAVFEEYANHLIDKNLEDMAAAGQEVFGNILEFRKEA